MIEHPELVKALAKPGEDICKTLTPETAHALHMAIGISGEVDELIDACLKKDVNNIREEFGDIEFYCEGLRQTFGIKVIRAPRGREDEVLSLRLVVAKGEILDQAKKLAIYNDPKRWDALLSSLIRFYNLLDLFYKQVNVSRKSAIQGNIEKLSVRYADMKYSDDAAQARADKAEGE